MNRGSLHHNSVDTVNAAATAIVTAESRVQPSSVQKKRWGGCWSVYWCFGSVKNSKRIGHAVLIPEPAVAGSSAPVSSAFNHSATPVIPFIAPPSSPASFLQSDPPSATQSPAGFLSLASLAVNTSSEASTIFTIGPYAYEPQLVTPPVFSAFTTEPSTASFTPPPEPVQLTTPSSPEVPFAQLLSSSLARNRRHTAASIKFPLSQYDYQPYQCPGSPGSRLISPGSAISNSGTSSPFPEKRPIIEFKMGEAPKFLGYEHFARKWGSRVGSGSLTPSGWGSRLGSGSLTPNGGLSRLGSGTLTPNAGEFASQEAYLLESQISEVASLANSENGSPRKDDLIDHRVSFELTREVDPNSLGKEILIMKETTLDHAIGRAAEDSNGHNSMSVDSKSNCEDCCNETINNVAEDLKLDRNISVGSSRDFHFDHMKPEIPDKPTVDCEWWTNEKVGAKEIGSDNKWNFFPMLQPGVS
ncbi:OLC1v1027460C1 [Oldenlandia corymbosa var. corymbosa]|uniref:OLC1v1027460C1 n=1 Tax=Oldenlandia corymbosa var. corymbosa TaxID=529605 RepID=A0AAV1C9T4_OLDCO|nr:OLC1v1027460C1 [Oldenlandia corymbosa var. corymbosa]